MRVKCPSCAHWHHTTADREQAHCPACGQEFPVADAERGPTLGDDPAVQARIDAELARQRERPAG